MSEKLPSIDRHRAETLARAEVLARIGCWELFPPQPELDACSEGLCALLALPPGSRLERAAYFARVHGADREAVERAFERAFADGIAIHLEHRVTAHDGVPRRLHCQSEARLDDRGAVKRVLVVFCDVTENERATGLRLRLLTRLLAAQDEERRRLGLELHDLFGQQLTALSVRLTELARAPTGALTLIDDTPRIVAAT